MAAQPSRSADPPATVSRRRFLRHFSQLGAAGAVTLVSAGCSAIRLPNVGDVVRGALGQAQQATGAAPAAKVLHWLTPIERPSDVISSSTPGTPVWNAAMGWSKLLTPWEAAHPDIQLIHDVVASADLTNQAIASRQRGDVADVAYTDWGGILGAAGVLDPIDVGTLLRTIVPVAMPIQSSANQVYALPIFLSCLGLYVNQDRVTQASLDPNTPFLDWTTFETGVQKLANRSQNLFGFDVFGSGSPLEGEMRYGPFLWSAGGSFFSDAGDAATWNQGGGLEALVFLARLSQNYAAPGSAIADKPTLTNNWLSGRTATFISGPELSASAEQQGMTYSVQSVPAYITDQASSLAMSAGAAGVFSQSKHKDWALDFVNYVASKDAQVAGLQYLRLLPASLDAGDAAPIFQTNATMGRFLKILREDDVHPFPLPISHADEVQAIFQTYLAVALQGLSTPEAAWNKAAAEATGLLKQPVATPTAG